MHKKTISHCAKMKPYKALTIINTKEMNNIRIAIIGLGYVGLPLARLFSTKFPTIGFDINPNRVEELMSGYDSTVEMNYYRKPCKRGYFVQQKLKRLGIVTSIS